MVETIRYTNRQVVSFNDDFDYKRHVDQILLIIINNYFQVLGRENKVVVCLLGVVFVSTIMKVNKGITQNFIFG